LENWIFEIGRDKTLDVSSNSSISVSSTSFLGGFFVTTEFLFEKLDVYQRSLAFVEAADEILSQQKGQIPYSRADQLSRASLSIPLNIAEGNGRFRPNDRRQFFTIARGSVFECVPILQIMLRKKLSEPSRYREIYSELQILARMLTKLMQREESKAGS
jgi:four helix bundle protein